MTERRVPHRRLSHAESELWTAVTADVHPFRARPARVPPTPETAPHRPPGMVQSDRPPPARPVVPLAEIDHRTRARIKRGRLDVDAKFDLHGMRQEEAHRALIHFLRRAQAQGARVVIVVTGKGSAREDGGVLRRMTPLWLQAPNLRDVVVGFGEAARQHGGEGALYVRIRRADRARY